MGTHWVGYPKCTPEKLPSSNFFCTFTSWGKDACIPRGKYKKEGIFIPFLGYPFCTKNAFDITTCFPLP